MNEMAPAEPESNTDSIEARLAAYRAHGVHDFDEAIDQAGQVRPHWRALLSDLASLPADQIASRSDRLHRRVRETGIDFDIFAHPNQPTQKWQLDLVPLLISPSEWRWLEKALNQRARLMDALLQDIYGQQRLLRDGMIPPELVFSDPTYLRPCLGMLPKAGPLRFFAADLARDANGSWRVVDNHAEALAGIGFAVANRVVHSHVAGDWFRRANAVRLSQFFQNMQSALTAHAGRENARIALLTPGPQHLDYFSHAYLARYLGYLLLEGPDLRTKGDRLHLKTLEGLKEIDLVIRCVDGRYIDPLELDPSGFHGTAGLLRVNRSHPRLVANAVGTAVIQNRGLGPYLARLSKELLGEDLLLPDARRHWLGDAKARRAVLDDLDRFIIRNAQEGTGRPGQAALGQEPSNLKPQERAHLMASIELAGAGLVAEEEFGLSQSPVIDGGRLLPRSFAIRFFIAQTANSFEVMPGGLAMSADSGRAVGLSTGDGHTRDVWVTSDSEQRQHVSLWRPMRENARVERSQRVIQSRVADDLFWLGRYHERADWTMRVLRGAYRRIEEDSGASDDLAGAYRTLIALLDVPASSPTPPQPTETDVERLCTQLIFGSESSRTLTLTCESLYRCANLARDRLSFEAWSTLSRFRPGDRFLKAVTRAAPTDVLDILDEGLASLAAFNGLMHENMTRNFGWRFMDLGRRVERALQMAELLNTILAQVTDEAEQTEHLAFLLETADCFITYRARYRFAPAFPLVLDLLMVDETNPRGIAFQLVQILDHVADLPKASQDAIRTPEQRLALDLLTQVRLADIEALRLVDADGRRSNLTQALGRLITGLPQLSDIISRRYFSLTEEQPHRVHTRLAH